VYYEKALELICKTNGYAYRRIGNTYVVATPQKLAEGFDVGLNKTFTLNFAKAADVATVIQGVFKKSTSKVDVSVDKRINAVIVSGTQETIDQVARLIKELDLPVPQVMIEAKIVEVSTEGLKSIGFQWDWGNTEDEKPDGNAYGHILKIAEFQAPIPNKDHYGYAPFDGSEIFKIGDFFRRGFYLRATLQALQTSRDAKVLSNPKVSALNGETANLVVGQKVIYGGTPDSPPQEKDTGVKLKITPRINEDGYITCEIEPEVSFVSGYEANYPKIDQRKAKTTVRVKDGEEILIGGLIQEAETYSEEKIPILGNIPILRALFSHKTRNRENRELIILITPHIMRRAESES